MVDSHGSSVPCGSESVGRWELKHHVEQCEMDDGWLFGLLDTEEGLQPIELAVEVRGWRRKGIKWFPLTANIYRSVRCGVVETADS